MYLAFNFERNFEPVLSNQIDISHLEIYQIPEIRDWLKDTRILTISFVGSKICLEHLSLSLQNHELIKWFQSAEWISIQNSSLDRVKEHMQHRAFGIQDYVNDIFKLIYRYGVLEKSELEKEITIENHPLYSFYQNRINQMQQEVEAQIRDLFLLMENLKNLNM